VKNQDFKIGLGVRRAVGATLGKTVFKCVFKGKITKTPYKIRCNRRVQIYTEVSCSNAE
jgi:hypothetical protein